MPANFPPPGYNPYLVHANRGLGALERKMGKNCPTFIWNGGTWNIIPNTIATKQNLTTGGFSQDFALKFSTLAAQFYTATVTTVDQIRALMLNTPMSYLGGRYVAGSQQDNYKITEVSISPNGYVLTIEANSIFQDA